MTSHLPAGCTCGWTVPRCDACLADVLFHNKSTAWVRGERWAQSVAAKVATQLPWPAYVGKCELIARSKVRDLAGGDERIHDALARECWSFAARTWEKIRVP